MERGKKKGVDLLTPDNGTEHIVLRISKQLLSIIPMMQPFFDGFNNVFIKWDSNSPNLSDAILSNADQLRCFTSFLSNAEIFYEEFKNRRKSDTRFKRAVKKFENSQAIEKEKEKKKEKRKEKKKKEFSTEIRILEVAQGLTRVQLPMNEYLKLFENTECEEKEKAKKAVEKVKQNVSLANARVEKVPLKELEVMQKHFEGYNVFSNNRRLVYKNRAAVILDEKKLFRYAVLFSDCLWLLSSKKGGDVKKTFNLKSDIKHADQFPFEDLEMEGCAFEKTYLRIRTKEKAITIYFEERDCHENYFEYMRRAHKNIKENKMRITESCAKHDSSIREIRRASTITYSQDPTNEESSSGTVSDFGFKNIVWTADFRSDLASDFCMMKNCNTEYGKKEKKRICMSCGWIICKKCCGEAPVEAYDFETKLVCPDCFNKIKMRFDNGLLFPENHPSSSMSGLQLSSKETGNIQLFKKPINSNLTKTDAEEHMKSSKVSGKAKLKKSQGKPITLLGKNVGYVVFRPADKWFEFYEKKDSKILAGWSIKSGGFKEVQRRNGVSFEFPEEQLAFLLKVPNSDADKWRKVFNWNFSKIN